MLIFTEKFLLIKFGKYPNEIEYPQRPVNVLEIRDFLSLCEIVLQEETSTNLLKDLNGLYVPCIKQPRLCQLQSAKRIHYIILFEFGSRFNTRLVPLFETSNNLSKATIIDSAPSRPYRLT